MTRARPLFDGHYQPRLPADLGFDDLRLPDVLETQALLAQEHGIFGFCFHYYWFTGGKRLLERPVDRMFHSGRPEFPFCLCWANENWTRRWDGQDAEVLISQQHDADSDIAFLHSVLPYFRDERYIRVNGRPVLVIYRATLFPDLAGTVRRWRDEMRRLNESPPYLVAAEAFDVTGDAALTAGFDASCEFPPHGSFEHRLPDDKWPRYFAPFSGLLLDYERVVSYFLARPQASFRRLKTVTLGWDNTARKKSAANIMVNFSLPAYHRWLSGVIDYSARTAPLEERLVFINAWNEWAEGTYLEPDQLYGHSYLEATREAILGRSLQPRRPSRPGRIAVGSGVSLKEAEASEALVTRNATANETASHCSRIVAIAVAGEDEDIIEAFVRENCRYVDRQLIFVPREREHVLQVLRSLEKEGLPVIVSTDAEDTLTADERLNQLMREAIDHWRPDWIVPLDADEFIDAAGRSGLDAALATVGPHHGRIPWITHVPTSFDEAGEIHPLKRIRYRYAYEPPAPDTNPRVWKLAINCRLLGPYLDRYELGAGAHTLVFRGTRDACSQPIRPLAGAALRHYPVRERCSEREVRSEHAGIVDQRAAAEKPLTVRDYLDLGRTSSEHTQGTPIVVDPFMPTFDLRYQSA